MSPEIGPSGPLGGRQEARNETVEAQQAQQFINRLNAAPINSDLRMLIVAYVDRRLQGQGQAQEKLRKGFLEGVNKNPAPSLPELMSFLIMQGRAVVDTDLANRIDRGELRGEEMVESLLNSVVNSVYTRNGADAQENLRNLDLATRTMAAVRALRSPRR